MQIDKQDGKYRINLELLVTSLEVQNATDI